MLDHSRRLAFATALLLGAIVPLPANGDDVLADVPIQRFHRVDEHLYRGAQPTEAGFRRLRDLGVRTVVNLRLEADAVRLDEQKIVESLGMRYVHLPVRDGNVFTWFRRIPGEAVARFFSILDTEPGPVFVHCHRGTDRTGALVALYRIARNGWEGHRASKEAAELGMRVWYRGLRRQIEAFDPKRVQAAPATRDGNP